MVYSITRQQMSRPGLKSGSAKGEIQDSRHPSALVAVVVPTRNERDSVDELLRQLGAAMVGRRWEVIFVDDSDDDTVDRLHQLSEQDHHVRVLHRPPGRRGGGLGGAVLEGFAATEADVLVVMDGDLQHPPATVPRLVDAITEQQADIVVATRYRDGGSNAGLANFFRVQASRGCRMLVRAVLPATRASTDPLGGFFAVRRAVVSDTQLQPHGYKILLEILVRGRWSELREVEYAFRSRWAGASKSGLAEAKRFLAHVRILRRARTAPPVSADNHRLAPLSILVFTSEVAPVVSGIATVMRNLRQGLTAIGHEVDVVSRADFPRLIHREFRFSAFLLSWPRFRRRLRRYDVVNVHGPVPTMSEIFLLLAATTMRARNRPAIVYTHHSDLAIVGLGRLCALYNRLHRRIARLSDAIVVSSEGYRDKLRTKSPVPIEIIPWGVDTERAIARRRRPQGELRVLFVGQLRSYKGVRGLIEAVHGLPGVSLTVVGDGPERQDLQEQVRSGGMDNVTFAGRVSDEELWRAYSWHDVIVLPSLTTAEAYGLVLGEGMAAGCVPVASDLPGVREVAGPAGMLVPPGDVHALRSTLAQLAADDLLMQRLAARCKERTKSMTLEAATARHDDVFRLVLERARYRRDPAHRPAHHHYDLEELQCPAC
jgi:glycosyltransferase involved in cell wall biosynthesis